MRRGCVGLAMAPYQFSYFSDSEEPKFALKKHKNVFLQRDKNVVASHDAPREEIVIKSSQGSKVAFRRVQRDQ